MEKCRCGNDYINDCILERRLDKCPDRALLVWSPTTDIPDQKCNY